MTWNTHDPDFTTCFQRTVLIWIPCLFFWTFSFLDIFYIKNSINRNVPWSIFSVSKLLFTSALILLTLVDLIVVFTNSGSDVYPVDYYTPAIKISTFALSATLLVFNRKYGLRTSGLQFLFWFFLCIFGIPQLRYQIRERIFRQDTGGLNRFDEYNFTSYIIFFGLSVAIWFVNCFADKEPLQTKYPKSEVSI